MTLLYVAFANSAHTLRWIRYFAEHGHRVVLASPVQPDGRVPEGVAVVRFPLVRSGLKSVDYVLGGLSLPLAVWRFRDLVQQLKPDLVHVHYLNDAALIAALSGVKPLVVTAWGSDVRINTRNSWVLRRIVRAILRRADVITCDAKHIADDLVWLGAELHRVRIVYFGTDTEQFHPARRDARIRTRLGIGTAPTIISTRRLDPVCDVETLLAAMPTVVREVGGVRLIVAGSGPDEARLRSMASALGLDDTIRFVGWLGQEDLPTYLASADVYVSTAVSDGGLAASTAEAMASELPVLITRFGDNEAWVRQGIEGLLFRPRDAAELAANLIRLLRNPEKRRQFGSNGRKMVVERNNWRVEMAKMESIYGALVKAS